MTLGFHRALRDFIENTIVLWYHLRKEVIDMAENKLADLSAEFAVKILDMLISSINTAKENRDG